MSDQKLDNKVTKKQLEIEHVMPEERKQSLQTALYNITKDFTYLGGVLQCLDIQYTHQIPRAGVMFDTNNKKWLMYLNPYYFCKILSDKQKMAVLLHEIHHLTHKHPLRIPFLKINENRRQLMNIAMDMSINQYIPNLPAGCQQCPPKEAMQMGAKCENEKCPGHCIDVTDYYDTDAKGNKVPWPTQKSAEDYYHKLIEKYSEAEEGEGEDGEGGSGGGKGRPEEFDSHNWSGNAEESEMMDATEDLMKRAMQKQGLSYDDLPGHIKELLEDIKARRSELNYRAMILSAIKKRASGFNREHSWTRPSRRFGNKAPGTRHGKLPHIGNYIDTSGSISIQEANDFLNIIDEFLKIGSRKCDLSLWHTEVYHSDKYRLGDRLTREVFQSGGTNMEPTMRHIHKTKPDLAIVLTDGCYSDVNYEDWLKPSEKFPQVIFIISKDGHEGHPLTRCGQTIKIPDTNLMESDKALES